MFVDRAMLNAIATPNTQLIEIVVSPWDIESGIQNMVFQTTEEPAAITMMGPIAHNRAADHLSQVLAEITPAEEILNIFAKD